MADCEWPEVLGVRDYNLFAFKEKEKDEFAVMKESMRGGNISLEEAISNATEIFGYSLDTSQTRAHGLSEYYELRDRCDKALSELNGEKTKTR